MIKTIVLFNHKGGVSKTTTTFNFGWMMASKGKKVVLVDTPIFALTPDQIGQGSTVLENTLSSRDNFNQIFSELADKIIGLTTYASCD